MSIEPRIWPYDTTNMVPLQIEAHLLRPMATGHAPMFDSLLADLWAQANRYPPAAVQECIPPVPLLWNEKGFHHASQAHYTPEAYRLLRWTKRPPDLRTASLLTDAKKINIARGTFRSYYMPLRTTWPVGGVITWWCVGDPEAIAWLLNSCWGVGAKRNTGHGRVWQWKISQVEEDWSILRPDGNGRMVPARPIPPDMAPAGWMWMRFCRLTYPYTKQHGEELLAVPGGAE